MPRAALFSKIAFVLVVLTLGWLAIEWLDLLPEHEVAGHAHEDASPYLGYLALVLIALLIAFRRVAIQKMQWALERAHRWASMLAMMGVVWIEAAMHLLNIPHMEGWWVPVLGGSSALSASMAWLRAKRK